MNDGDVTTLSIAEQGIDSVIAALENSHLTEVLRASFGERMSRSCMLLYHGRAVGCIYSSKETQQTPPTKQALSMMLHDMAFPETKLWMYRLPENIIPSALRLVYRISYRA